MSYLACKLTLAYTTLVQQANMQGKIRAHVCELDKKETLKGKLMWVFQRLSLLSCVAGCHMIM